MSRTDLPTGTVTFFFSDIEGSTRLLERIGQAYRDVLHRHNEIVREAIAAQDGVEVQTEGDSFFAVFATAPSAVDASAVIQQRLAAVDWPRGGVVKIRIGLHTGLGELGGDNYLGLDVHRASRISDAGHGGQVVVSASTKALATGRDFIDLGSHRLKDLAEPEHLYQVIVPSVPQSFPPLRTRDARPNNLPALPNPLLGRDEERSTMLELVTGSRLVTILGVSGVGKTHLALDVAAAALPSFDDGVFFVDLASTKDPSLVMAAIAAELDIDASDVAGIAEAIGRNTMLLVLDNVEQVVEAAPQIGELLGACTGMKILATSQAPLRISGEILFRLKPLAVALDGSSLSDSPAVELFAARAATADPSFSLHEHGSDVAALVTALEGLPLAVELAAARVNVLTPAQILERLDGGSSGSSMLRSRTADVAGRHRSLEDAIAWSYGLLTPTQQQALGSLAVFRGGATLAALEAVAAEDVLDDLGELVDRSLVRTRTTESGKRFDVMESVRRFAASQRSDAETTELAERHTRHFSDMGASAETGFLSERSARWLASFEDDHENFQTVFARLIDAGDAARGLEMMGGMWRYYRRAGRLGEASLWLDRLFRLPSAAERTAPRARGLMARAALKYWRTDFTGALDDYEEAVAIAEGTRDQKLLADANFGMITCLGAVGRFEEAAALIDQVELLYEQLEDVWGRAHMVSTRAFHTAFTEGIAAFAGAGAAAVDAWEATGNRTEAAQISLTVAGAEYIGGNVTAAMGWILRGLDYAVAAGDRSTEAFAIEVLATGLIATGDLDTGTLLAGAAASAREHMGGGWVADVGGFVEDPVTLATAALGESDARRMLARGAELSLDEAIELARTTAEERAAAP